MTQPAFTTLSPDEWKQLCLLNVGQLQNYLLGIPALTESGASGMTDEHLAQIEAHVTRGQSFLIAWRKSSVGAARIEPPAAHAEGNGAEPTIKRRGGWPKGKKRTRQVPAPQ